jgi:hypothetical protein
MALNRQVSYTQAQQAALEVAAIDVQATIEACLELAERCSVAYKLASPGAKREWNQAWWEWLEVNAATDARQAPVMSRALRTRLMETILTAEVMSRTD